MAEWLHESGQHPIAAVQMVPSCFLLPLPSLAAQDIIWLSKVADLMRMFPSMHVRTLDNTPA